MSEQKPEDSKRGLVVSIDLGELWTDGNVDDRIADIVAEKMLDQVGQEARERISDHVRSLRADVIREQVEPIVAAELEKPITLTNRYGEATPGAEPVTLVDLIQRQVEAFMSSSAGRRSGGLDDTETELGKMIREAVGREFKGELEKAVKEAKAQALEKVRQAAGDVIAESVRRAGGML